MSEMVERVARAICQNVHGGNDPCREDYQAARAAIEAMRDTGPNFSDSHLPFPMIDAGMTLLETAADDLAGRNGRDVPDWDYGMEAVAVYRSMIDAALSSEAKP